MSGKKKNDKFKDIFLNSERINWHSCSWNRQGQKTTPLDRALEKVQHDSTP